MPANIDITGKKYGRLTAINREYDYTSPKGYKKQMWLFKCDCGNEIIRNKSSITKGECLSCGCEKIKRIVEYNKKNKLIHGKRNTRLYRILTGMKTRCYNSKDKSFRLYGQRGIIIYQDWLDKFVNFYNWAMANGYQENLTIDRIDANGNYEPSNCRWVDMKTQSRNKRKHLMINDNGINMCFSQYCEKYGLSSSKERHRYLKDKENYLKNTRDLIQRL